MVLSDKNAKRGRFGTIHLRTGHRWWLVRDRQRAVDFGAVLKQIHRRHRAWHVVVFLDEDSRHTARATPSPAARHDIHLAWRPKRSPPLDPVDHLWRDAQCIALANRQHHSLDALVRRVPAYLNPLTPGETLRKAGLMPPDFWRRDKR